MNGGHSLKSRSLVTIVEDSVLGDGMLGRGSGVADTPQGGTVIFRRCTFIKGPMAQNTGTVQFGRETRNDGGGFPRNAGNSLHFEDCVWINLYAGTFGSGLAIGVLVTGNDGQPVFSTVDGSLTDVQFLRCQQFGFDADHFLQQAGRVATGYPPGVTTLLEPPPLDFRSPMLAGTPVLAPAPWSLPNSPAYTGWNYNGSTGLIEAGAHEIRVPHNAAVGTQVAQLKAWGITDLARSDPNYDPFTGGAWSVNPAGMASSAYFDVTASGGVVVKQSLTAAPVLHFMHAEVASSSVAGRKTDAVIPIIVSDTPARTDCIPAALTQPVRPLGQESLG